MTKPEKSKVEDLKEKARRRERSSGATAESVLYGPQNDNETAQGAGEFNQ